MLTWSMVSWVDLLTKPHARDKYQLYFKIVKFQQNETSTIKQCDNRILSSHNYHKITVIEASYRNTITYIVERVHHDFMIIINGYCLRERKETWNFSSTFQFSVSEETYISISWNNEYNFLMKEIIHNDFLSTI